MIKGLYRFLRRLRRRAPAPRTADRNVRLHLGCGMDYWPGYMNVDVNPVADCDLCLDFMRLGEMYAEGSIAEVAMIHSLSYLRLWQARDLMSDLYRLLQPGGWLIIELPDLAKCANQALASEGDLANYLEAVRGLYAFGMEQIARREMFTTYAFGWSSWHLKYELEQAGFKRVSISNPQTHACLTWRDTRLEAIK